MSKEYGIFLFNSGILIELIWVMIIGSKKSQIILTNIVVNKIVIIKIDVLNISLDAKDVT